MGIFSRIFGLQSSLEKELEELHVSSLQALMGLSLIDARTAFRAMLKAAKEEAMKEGTLNLPPNLGDTLLKKEATDEKIKTMLAKKRKEGVRDADIRWWWNMYDLERRMALKVDEMFRLAFFMKCREEDGLDENEAAKKVRKAFPIFGNPDDTTHTTGDDRPLPYELKNRINIYMIEKRAQANKEKFKMELEKWSTVNAFIRNVIKRGNL